MQNLLIVLGSNYVELHEYDLPIFIDKNAYWDVYSIDYSKNEDYTIGNIHIYRIGLSISDFEIQSIENYNNIYIMDSISCGFVTNKSIQLIKFCLENSQANVYWTHYISPYNESPSVSLKDYSDDDIKLLFNVIFTSNYISKLESNSRHYENAVTVLRNSPNIHDFIYYTGKDSIYINNKNDTILLGKKILSIIDIENYIKFYDMREIKIEDIIRYNISCSAGNPHQF